MPRSYGSTNLVPYDTAPPVGLVGEAYYNTTDKKLYISDGTAWIASQVKLDDVLDVNAPTPGGHQALIWDEVTSQWAPGVPSSTPINLADLYDVGAAAPANEDALTWNGTQWEPQPFPVTTVVASALPGTLQPGTLYVVVP